MLNEVAAVRFDGRAGSGKTWPCLINCADSSGQEYELVVKLAAGCERKVNGLVAEAIAAGVESGTYTRLRSSTSDGVDHQFGRDRSDFTLY